MEKDRLHDGKHDSDLFVALQRNHRFFIVFFSYLYLMFIACMQLIKGSTQARLLVLFTLAVIFYLRLMVVIYYRKTYGLFHPLVFGSIQFIITSIFRNSQVYIHGLYRHRALPDLSGEALTTLVAYGLLMEAISVVAYYCGYFKGPLFRIPHIQLFQPRHVKTKAIFVVFLSVVFFQIYAHEHGGLMMLYKLLGQGRTSAVSEGRLLEHWQVFIRFGSYGCLLWFLIDQRAYCRPLFWLASGVAVSILFLSSGSRSNVVILILLGIFIWMLREKRMAIPHVIVGSIVGLVFIGVLGQLRWSTWRGFVNWKVLTNFSILKSFYSAFSEMQFRTGEKNALYPIIEKVPDQVGLLYGSSYAALLMTPIPRVIWSGKPQGIGPRTARTFFGALGGIPPGPIGEAFWNFHVPGLLLVFFMYGNFHRWLVRVFSHYHEKPGIIALYIFTLYYFSPYTPSIIFWIQGVFIFFIIMFLFGMIKPSHR